MDIELSTSDNIKDLKSKYDNYLTTTSASGTWMSPILQPEISRQQKLSGKISTLQDLATVSTVPSWFTATSFNGIYPLKGPPESHLKFDFESSPTGWIGIYGQTKTYRLTFGVARNTLTPSKDGSTSILSFFGGIGSKKSDGTETWTPFKILFPGTSQYFSQTESTIKINLPGNNSLLVDLNAKPVFKGQINTGKKSFTFSANPQNSAVYNGKNGCVPVCFGGIGTSYWSFTSLALTLNNEKGLGWFDHQWVSWGVPKGLIPQFLYGLITKGKVKTAPKWIWLGIQKTSDLLTTDEQYQTTVSIDSGIKKGESLDTGFIHYSKGKVTNYSQKGSIEITDMVQGFPVILKLTVNNQELEIRPLGNAVNVVKLLNGTENWEGPAQVTQNGKAWGVGFLEVNNMKPGNTAIEDVLRSQNILEKSENLDFPGYISNAFILIIIICSSVVLIVSVSLAMTN